MLCFLFLAFYTRCQYVTFMMAASGKNIMEYALDGSCIILFFKVILLHYS